MAQSAVTVGVDLSARDPKTWMATIEWAGSQAFVRLERGVGDARLVEAAAGADKVGIDCPFGWPVAFTKYVSDHAAGDVKPQGDDDALWRSGLANRVTDIWVKRHTGLNPLSVSADRIGHVAFRCAHLLATMKSQRVEVDRSGRGGVVVEVYPAASLRIWKSVHRSYKGKDGRQVLQELATEFLHELRWLDMSETDRAACRSNDDAFDAVIAGLTARAQQKGLVEVLTEGQVAIGRVEGWIALPLPDALGLLPA